MPGPPVIEGALKNTINALAFGLICATLVVNFGKYFIPNFFPYMVGILIAIEVVLFSFDKPKENYDKFQAPGIRGKHTIEGAGSPQIMVSAPPGEDPDGSPRKRDRIKDKLKTKKDQKGRRESGVPGSPNAPGSPKRQSLVPPPSPGQEAMDGRDMEHEKGKDKSAEKERKKEEEKAKKKEKEEEKERQKAEKKEHKEKGKEDDAEKSEKGTWRKRKATKQDSV